MYSENQCGRSVTAVIYVYAWFQMVSSERITPMIALIVESSRAWTIFVAYARSQEWNHKPKWWKRETTGTDDLHIHRLSCHETTVLGSMACVLIFSCFAGSKQHQRITRWMSLVYGIAAPRSLYTCSPWIIIFDTFMEPFIFMSRKAIYPTNFYFKTCGIIILFNYIHFNDVFLY